MSSFVPSTAQAWVLLLIAGLLEVGWAVGMKSTDGFTRWGPTAAVLLTALLSFYLLALAMKTLPVGTAYAVWVGIGAAGAALLGVVLLGEPASLPRTVSLLLIVAGVVGLRVYSGAQSWRAGRRALLCSASIRIPVATSKCHPFPAARCSAPPSRSF